MLRRISVILLVIAAADLLLSIVSQRFSDFMRNVVFRPCSSVYGRITSLVPFSIGELLIIVAIAVAFVFIVLSLIFVILFIGGKWGSHSGMGQRLIRRYLSVVFLVFSIVFLVMTVNCYSLYHATGLGSGEETYSPEELRELRNEVVEKTCALSLEVKRNTEGYAVFEENGLSFSQAGREARRAVSSLSDEYPLFKGFIVRPKPMMFSALMSQSYMQGYYFPFSMESNINVRMQDTHIPTTMCHELSHTVGYMSEDDANYLGFLSCARSGDPFFRYSGYLGVLYYVDNEYRKAKLEKPGDPEITDLVKRDAAFLTEEEWKQVEEQSVLDTETVHKMSDAFVEGNLKVNGVSQGMKIYSEVVKRLLDHRRREGCLP